MEHYAKILGDLIDQFLFDVNQRDYDRGLLSVFAVLMQIAALLQIERKRYLIIATYLL